MIYRYRLILVAYRKSNWFKMTQIRSILCVFLNIRAILLKQFYHIMTVRYYPNGVFESYNVDLYFFFFFEIRYLGHQVGNLSRSIPNEINDLHTQHISHEIIA